jgi:hypothetical protein
MRKTGRPSLPYGLLLTITSGRDGCLDPGVGVVGTGGGLSHQKGGISDLEWALPLPGTGDKTATLGKGFMSGGFCDMRMAAVLSQCVQILSRITGLTEMQAQICWWPMNFYQSFLTAMSGLENVLCFCPRKQRVF